MGSDWVKDKATYLNPLVFVVKEISQPNTCAEVGLKSPSSKVAHIVISLALQL